jgi:hypothetical protein
MKVGFKIYGDILNAMLVIIIKTKLKDTNRINRLSGPIALTSHNMPPKKDSKINSKV